MNDQVRTEPAATPADPPLLSEESGSAELLRSWAILGWLGIFVACLLFVMACFVPAVNPGQLSIQDDIHGYECLMFGWFDPVPWSANVLLAAGLLLVLARRRGAAACCGGAATLLALTTPFSVHAVLLGFHLWCASLGGFTLAASLLAWVDRRWAASQPPLRFPKKAGKRWRRPPSEQVTEPPTDITP
jgi:hypothetical protein